MTKIKLCGLARPADVEAVNELMPEYAGFILVPGRRRYIAPEEAARLRKQLSLQIQAVGVFINEKPELIAELLREGTIDVTQLHGNEDEGYIKRLRAMTDRPIIKAFRIETIWIPESEEPEGYLTGRCCGRWTGPTFWREVWIRTM